MLLPELECSLPSLSSSQAPLSLLQTKFVIQHFFYKRMCAFLPFLKSYTRNNKAYAGNRVRNKVLKSYVTLQPEHLENSNHSWRGEHNTTYR